MKEGGSEGVGEGGREGGEKSGRRQRAQYIVNSSLVSTINRGVGGVVCCPYRRLGC